MAYRTAASMRQAMIPVATSWPRFSRPLVRMAGSHPASLSCAVRPGQRMARQTDILPEGKHGLAHTLSYLYLLAYLILSLGE